MADARQEGPKLDTTTFAALAEESRDLHVDAMKVARASLPDLADIGDERKGEVSGPELVAEPTSGAVT